LYDNRFTGYQTGFCLQLVDLFSKYYSSSSVPDNKLDLGVWYTFPHVYELIDTSSTNQKTDLFLDQDSLEINIPPKTTAVHNTVAPPPSNKDHSHTKGYPPLLRLEFRYTEILKYD
jgi:hypothetical protein